MFLTLSAASLAYVGAAAWLDRRGRRPVPPEFSTFQQGIFAKLRDRFLG